MRRISIRVNAAAHYANVIPFRTGAQTSPRFGLATLIPGSAPHPVVGTVFKTAGRSKHRRSVRLRCVSAIRHQRTAPRRARLAAKGSRLLGLVALAAHHDDHTEQNPENGAYQANGG